MAVHLSEHFTFKKLFKAVMPSIFMMVFTSIYSIVDGLFVSNFVGKTQFSSLNFVFPVIMALGAVGFMFGAGGSALVAKTLGEGDRDKANRIFSTVVYFNIIIGIALSVGAYFFIEPVASLLGATDEMLPYCALYGKILAAATFMFMLQNIFQSFFVVAEKPMLGFVVTVCAGVANMVLDAVFVVGFKMGLAGAAFATAMSYVVGGIIPIVYFSVKNKSLLRLVKTKFDFKAILKSATNGSSEFFTNISSSVVGMLFNAQLLKLAGEDGVAAYGVIMYASFIFAAIFIGYGIGTAPVIGYHFGAGNTDELKNILIKSLCLICITGVVMTGLMEALAFPLSKIFVSYDQNLLDLTVTGMRWYSLSFLVCGINIFASSFFTSLNNGIISAIISFARTLVFQVICVLLLPIWLGVTGIWLSAVISEVLSTVISVVCIFAKRKKYKYL
ncbi:MAG: MATE family efflux transporter [Corallococcus sp.]|nr:MATE family efflux transporter [Corallococcus sp.]